MARRKRAPKYPAPYKSNFEYTIAQELEKLKSRAKYEPIKLPYTLDFVYNPDWVLPNGIILEAKGKLDYETRRKMLGVKEAHPDLDIRFVFMRATNKIRKGSATSYGDWATANGFKWADGHIPKSWITE